LTQVPSHRSRTTANTLLQIVEGAATVAWAICAYFILLDFPSNTKRLTERERALAISRLQAANVHSVTEGTEQLSHLQALKSAVTSWRVWLFVAGYMVIVGSSTLSYFYPTLVLGLGYTATMAQVCLPQATATISQWENHL
jgi:hypothetical protein